MVTKISTQILQYILEHTYIPDNMKDIYLYGIEITISSMLNVILVFLCSLINGEVIAGLIYLTIFVFLRSFTGGYHATTYFRCNATMVITYILTTALYKIIENYEYALLICAAITFVDLIPIILYTPVFNIHKPLNQTERSRTHILSIIITSTLFGIGITLLTLGVLEGIMIITTVTAVSVLIIVEICMQRRGYHESK